MIREARNFEWNGRPQINQVVVITDKGNIFFSYGRPVVFKGSEGVLLSEYWNHSKTTAKWVARFLDCDSSREVSKKVAAGEYGVINELSMEE
jgi:hypothetical protein